MGIGCHGFLDLKNTLCRMDYLTDELRETMFKKHEQFYILRLNADGALFIE